MTAPAERCLRALEFLAPVTDSLVATRVLDALDEMERAYPSSEEHIDALARVLREISHQAWGQERTPFKRFVAAVIEQRLSKLRSEKKLLGTFGEESGIVRACPRPATPEHRRQGDIEAGADGTKREG